MNRVIQQLEITHYGNPRPGTDGLDNLNPGPGVDRHSARNQGKAFIRQMGCGRRIRKSNRFRHESIVRIEDGSSRYPFFALMYNTSKHGIYVESLFGLECGQRINIKIEKPPYSSAPENCSAKVVWCRALIEASDFRYGVGLAYC